jgi:hypothetical protein
MSINKNFVISNGLEVNNDLIYASADTRRVGINSAIPDFELDVNGTLSFTGGLSVGGTTGAYGQWLESTGDGVQWRSVPTLRVVERYTATEGQTIFPESGFFPFENAEFIDVFVDGVKLAQDEYNTLVGNNRIELLAAAIAGETIELVAYNASTVAAGYTGIQGLTVAEDGVIVGLSDGVKLLNFVGAYITAIGSGAGVTVFLDDRLAQDTNYWLSNASGLSTTTNVGVKNSNPTRTLDVTGTARVTSGLEAGTFYSASGVSTFSNVIIGSATTELVVNGSARITGILTIGTSSVTIDGVRNEIKIGTAVTLNQSGNAYLTGIVTAQSFDGNGADVSNVDAVTLAGLGSDSFLRADANDSFTGTLSGSGSLNITGVATASRISASTGTVTTLTGTSFNYTGVNTATTLFSTTSNATTGNIVTGVVTTLSGTSFNYTGVNTATTLFSTTANLNRGNIVTGVVTTLSGTSFNYTGVNTATTLFSTTANATTANIVTGIVTNLSGTNASYSGIGTVGSLNIGATQVISSGRQLQNIASLDATTTATIESAIQSAPNNFNDLNVTGISTLGATSVTNLTAQSINNSGITTTNSLNIDATQVISSGRQLQNIASLDATTTATIESAIANAPNTFTDLNVSGVTTSIGGFVGNLTGNSSTATYATSSGIATYATNAGVSTYATSSDIATYATTAGIATYATSSGLSTYATTAGVSTYATSSGIATYSSTSGIATVAQGLTGTPNIVVGVATVTENLNAPGNYYVKLARLTNQTILNAADTLIGFSTISDPNNWYSGITTSTTPTVAGTYHVDLMVNWQAGSITNDQTNIQIRKNGTTFALSQVGIQTFSYTQNACGIVTMNGTTDYIEVTVYTSNPTSQNITGTVDGAWTKMEIFKIN